MMMQQDTMTGDRVRGRATGALFFLGFGAVWMYLGLVQTHHATAHAVELLAAGIIVLLVIVWMLLRRARDLPAGRTSREEEERAGRMFVAVNIIQWVSIGTAVAILGLLHLPQYVAPAIAIIVGLHLLPLAESFRNPLHYVTGGLLIAWACGCLLLQPPARVSGDAALGAGVILLASAAVMLGRNVLLLRSCDAAELRQRVEV